MDLLVNELLEFKKANGESEVERILWVDENNNVLFTINIDSDSALPIIRTGKEINEAFENEELIKMNNDPYIRFIDEDNLSEKDKEIRDKAWKIIEKIVSKKNEPDIFYRIHRGALVKSVMEEHKVSKAMLYKYLRRYWQRGKNKSALIPDYVNSGAKGKERVAGEKKRGRPRKNVDITGLGINVDKSTKKIFRLAINKYFHTQKENSLVKAYELMLRNFYSEDYLYENGIRKSILIPEEERPSFTQFKYWYEKEVDIKKALTKRKGSKKFELLHRSVLGKSDTDVYGPGSLYQIDATVGNFYLVSRYNADWIIGKPVIYAVIDVFSRLITGIYVGLEGPSWIGAMMALANAATDKVKYCKEYEIDINEEEWPCRFLPEAIIGDRGEMESKKVKNLINSLQVDIKNTPPYRADWKGIIEKHFDVTNEIVKPFVPGYVDTAYRERGTKDYRLDAKLDIYEFTQIIIQCVLSHNKEQYMDYFTRSEDMIRDNINPIPNELWNWGIKNRSGRLRSFPEDIVKLNLMPEDSITVTEKGIKFKRLHYSCDSAVKEMWFEKARNKGSWKLPMSYDPRNLNYIYLRSEDGRSFEKCFLLESQERYFNKCMEEIDYLIEMEKLNKKTSLGKEQQAKVNLIDFIEDVVNKAQEKRSVELKPRESKASKLKNIKQNRKEEKMVNRDREAFELGEISIRQDAEITMLNSQENLAENLEYPDDIELLMRKQKERLNGKRRT